MTLEKSSEEVSPYVHGKSIAYKRKRRLRERNQIRRKKALERKERAFGTASLSEEERGRLQELRQLYD